MGRDSYWNYRVVEDEAGFGIREVYYERGFAGYGYSAERMALNGETLDELKEDFALMAKAFDYPAMKIVDGKLIAI